MSCRRFSLHPGITQEVAPNESQRGPKATTGEALVYEALLWRLGSSVDLKRAHNPKVVGSNPTPATMNDEGLADAGAASPFRLPRLHPGIGFGGAVSVCDATGS